MLTRFLRGSSLVFAGILAGKLVAMVSSIIMARSLSPHRFGIYLLGLSILQIAAIVSNLGIPGVLPSLIAKIDMSGSQDGPHRLVRGAIYSCLGPALFLSAAVYACADFVSVKIFHIPEISGMLKLTSAIIPPVVITSVLTAAFRGYGRTWPRVIFQDLLPGLLTLLFFLALIRFGFELSGAYIAFGMSSLLVFVLIARSIKKKLGMRFLVRIRELTAVIELLRLSWPLGIESLVWVVYTQIDKLLIGCFLPPSQVGIYAAAASLSVILSIIPQAFSYLALPAFSSVVSNGSKHELGLLYGKITKIIFQISFPVFLCLVMLSKEILTALYGDAYSNGSRAMAILAAGLMISCLLGPTSEILVSAGRTKAPLAASAAGCIANVSLNAVLIPRYGINGAAIANSCSVIVSLLVSGYFIHRYFNLLRWDRDYILCPVVCLGLAPLVLLTTRLFSSYPLLASAAITGSVYCLSVYALLYGMQWRKLAGVFSGR